MCPRAFRVYWFISQYQPENQVGRFLPVHRSRYIRMKIVMMLILQGLALASHANKYYFSSTGGDDSRSPLQARNALTPWRTLNKLNVYFSQLMPGDSVLLKRGETFAGPLIISRSGASGSPIVISAYGSGTKPIIIGLTSFSNWNAETKGVWSSPCMGCGEVVNILTINDSIVAMGRYPNASDNNSGYRSISDHNKNKLITDSSLGGDVNWAGAELVTRKNRFIIDRSLIMGSQGGKITYSGGSFYEPTNKFGYFIQNHLKTLDQDGEWYFDKSTRRMYIYFAAGKPPKQKISAAITDTLVKCRMVQYILLEDLCLMGSNFSAVSIVESNHITISYCDILYSGADAITVSNSDNNIILGNLIEYTNNDAVVLTGLENQVVRNRIINTGTIAGMGGNENSYIALSIKGDRNIVSENQIDNTGYLPIIFLGNQVIVKNNLIRWFGLIKDDGGGIYTWSGRSAPQEIQTGRLITGNMIMNGLEAKAGTDGAEGIAAGIYLDDNAGGVAVFGNTVSGCTLGLYLHNTHEVSADSNTLYGNGIQLYIKHDQAKFEMRNNFIHHNYLVSATEKQRLVQFFSSDNQVSGFADLDSNYYIYPKVNEAPFSTFSRMGRGSFTYYSLDSWRKNFQFDLHSNIKEGSNPMLFINAANKDTTIRLDAPMADAKNQTHEKELTLKPYHSIVLFRKNPQ